MRIWDVPAGYLNRQSLLGEHRELHGLRSILVEGKTGYALHPETLRWVGCLNGLAQRHAWLVAEMRLRGYVDRSPIRRSPRLRWPGLFVTPVAAQYRLLTSKYVGREEGRIRLPRSAQELWAHHKYSVLARDPAAYQGIGRRVARMRRGAPLDGLAEELVLVLREVPTRSRLANALEHMWGYVASGASLRDRIRARASIRGLFDATRRMAVSVQQPYLLSSTALSELAPFV